MIRLIEKLFLKMKLLWALVLMTKPLTLTRTTEKFDVIQRVPVYARIKF